MLFNSTAVKLEKNKNKAKEMSLFNRWRLLQKTATNQNTELWSSNLVDISAKYSHT